MSKASKDRRESWRIAPNTAAIAAAVAFCCWWSITFTRGPAGVSTLWVASGLLCGVLVTSPQRRWPAYVAGAFLASLLVNLWRGTDPLLAAGLSLANTLDASLIALAVSRQVKDVTDQVQIKRTAKVAMLSTLGACALSALLAAVFLASARDGSFGLLFRSWFASHVLGIVVFANLVVIARADGWHTVATPGRRIELTPGATDIDVLGDLFRVGYPVPF